MTLSKLKTLLAFFLVTVIAAGCQAPRAPSTTSFAPFPQIVRDIEAAQVSEVAVYFLPYSFSGFVTISPSDLIALSRRTVRRELRGELRLELLHALVDTKARQNDWAPDCHWGIRFLSPKGVCLHEVYLDSAGKHGIVNNLPVKVNRPLYRWLEKYFST